MERSELPEVVDLCSSALTDVPLSVPDGGREPPPTMAYERRACRRDRERRRRDALIDEHMHLATHLARRYTFRGVPREDLEQTALLALVQAAERFDPELGLPFVAFASRTIDGTLKRHFRDRTWWVRPPRRVQELHLQVRRTEDDLEQRLGRAPTRDEIAAEIDRDVRDVDDARLAAGSRSIVSTDQPRTAGAEGHETEHPSLGAEDAAFGHAETRLVISTLLDRLGEQDREILRLRFEEGLTQHEIGDLLGYSQSYLSRLLRRALASMRAELDRVTA